MNFVIFESAYTQEKIFFSLTLNFVCFDSKLESDLNSTCDISNLSNQPVVVCFKRVISAET